MEYEFEYAHPVVLSLMSFEMKFYPILSKVILHGFFNLSFKMELDDIKLVKRSQVE